MKDRSAATCAEVERKRSLLECGSNDMDGPEEIIFDGDFKKDGQQVQGQSNWMKASQSK